jgi:hypothetical protein
MNDQKLRERKQSQLENDVRQVNRGSKGAATQVAARLDLAVVSSLCSPARVGEGEC